MPRKCWFLQIETTVITYNTWFDDQLASPSAKRHQGNKPPYTLLGRLGPKQCPSLFSLYTSNHDSSSSDISTSSNSKIYLGCTRSSKSATSAWMSLGREGEVEGEERMMARKHCEKNPKISSICVTMLKIFDLDTCTRLEQCSAGRLAYILANG